VTYSEVEVLDLLQGKLWSLSVSSRIEIGASAATTVRGRSDPTAANATPLMFLMPTYLRGWHH
jgi:hypothetical protein